MTDEERSLPTFCSDETCIDYDEFFDDNCGCKTMALCGTKKRKERWLSEAKARIDAMTSKEFEDFIVSCVPTTKPVENMK